MHLPGTGLIGLRSKPKKEGIRLGSEAMIGIVRNPLDLGLGWYIRVGTVSRICVILVFEYTVIKKSRQQESDAHI